MALREDYYGPCVGEIEEKIKLINEIITEITTGNFDDDCGLENLKYSTEFEDEITAACDLLEGLVDVLNEEKGKLADDIADVGGWF